MGNILGYAAITDWGTFTGNGGGTTFNITHNVTLPNDLTKAFCIVQAGSPAAIINNTTTPPTVLTFYTTLTATNIIVTYHYITPSGSGNITLHWMVGKKHAVREEIYAVTRDTIPDE